MSEHSPEPWAFNYAEGYVASADAERAVICENWAVDWADDPVNHANMRRIVACVNACRGIPTSILEAIVAHGSALRGDLTLRVKPETNSPGG